MSGPRPQRSSYHQKALQQIRNSLQPFATCDTGSTSSGISSLGSSGGGPTSSSPSYSPSPSGIFQKNSSPGPGPSARAIEYRAQQYPFVPSQVPASVQQLLRRIDSPSSGSSSSSSSPTSQLQPFVKKPTLVIKSTVVPKPVLQTAIPPPPPYPRVPPPLPPKPSKKFDDKQMKTDENEQFGSAISPSKLDSEGSPNSETVLLAGNDQHIHNGMFNGAQCFDVNERIQELITGIGEINHSMSPNLNSETLSQSSKTSDGRPDVDESSDISAPSEAPTDEIHTHESPIPERKKLSREKEEERFESKVRVYSPQAFKFFMEQHVENVIKSHQERMHRRMQLESEMAKIGLSDEAQTQMRRMLCQKESNYIRLKRAKMDKSLFKQIRIIGVGAFGEVALVRKVDTQHLYAMKTLRKSDVLRRNQVAHVKAERDILAEADNEWVVKLYYSFQDMDHLYFVMDYIPGGDLMSLLIKKGIFEESLARFYIAELTCAVESVHKMGFIHRDIKPDNILIDRDGHIKLTDFGLCTGFRWTHNSKYYQDTNCCSCVDDAKWQICSCDDKPLERRRRTNVRCLAHSLVGTPNYIAPEVLLRTGYTQLCDWWSVGVILYEMLVGQPPFLAPTPAETQYKVINWASTLHIPSQANVSSHAKDLILQLCTDHSRRLGMSGAHQVKAHQFFASVQFEAGLRRTVAPYIPKIRHPTDTSNFDPCDGDKMDEYDSGPLDSNQFHGFFEFTFRRFFDDAYNEDGCPVYV